jgi:hypothetical protein
MWKRGTQARDLATWISFLAKTLETQSNLVAVQQGLLFHHLGMACYE